MKRHLVILLVFTTVISFSQENKKPFLFKGENIIRGDIGYSFSKVSYLDTTNILYEYFRHSIKLNLNINPWRNFYFRNTFFIDLNDSDIKPPWLSNYYYQIGIYSWRNKTFSYGYENYQANKWEGFFDNFYTNFKRGYFFVSYNYIIQKPKSKSRFRPLFWDETSKISLKPIIKVHPEYQDEFNDFDGYFKPVAGMNIRYVIIKNIYIETGLYYYPIHKTKLPWDPDFTYGFGIFDSRPFKINFSYGNWIANRFPWNTKELDYHNFLNGTFGLNFTYSW